MATPALTGVEPLSCCKMGPNRPGPAFPAAKPPLLKGAAQHSTPRNYPRGRDWRRGWRRDQQGAPAGGRPRRRRRQPGPEIRPIRDTRPEA